MDGVAEEARRFILYRGVDMRLLDKSLTTREKRNELDMLEGNIARIAVSDNVEEVVAQLGFAIDRLSLLAYSRIKEIENKKDILCLSLIHISEPTRP